MKVSSKTNISTPPVIPSFCIASAVTGSLKILINSSRSDVSTTAGAITNVNNVGGSIANVNTVASNLSGVNSFAERYRIQAGVPSTSNDVGDLVFDTTAQKLKVFEFLKEAIIRKFGTKWYAKLEAASKVKQNPS